MQKPGRAIAESEGAVETQTVSRGAVHVRTETRGPQLRRGGWTRKERRGSRLLNSDVETEHRRVLLPENTEHDAGCINHGNRGARVAAERLTDRGSRDVRLLRRA